MPTFAVRCDNPNCAYRGVVRHAAHRRVGAGLYARSEVLCECGLPVVDPSHPAVEKAVKRAPERRAG